MKIVIMADEVFEEEVQLLVSVVQGFEPETDFYPIKRKAIELPVLEVIIYIAKGLEHVMLAKILEEGIKWGSSAIERHRHEPFVITLFGEDGIPLARKKIVSGEIQDVPLEKVPRMASIPIHLL